MIENDIRRAIREAYRAGTLAVEAVEPDSGRVVRRPLEKVMRHDVRHKRAFRVATERGDVIATEDHSLFLRAENGIREVQTSHLVAGDRIVAVADGDVVGLEVVHIEEVDTRQHMYDLSVPGPENFVIANGIVAHNSYSIGGISLDLERSSKYESLKSNAEGQLDKAAEAKARTVKFIRGLQQPKFGFGVRSSFGPQVGRGVLSPRSFV